jgi:hypothetical protein
MRTKFIAGSSVLFLLFATSLCGQTGATSVLSASEKSTPSPDNDKKDAAPASALEKAKHPFQWLAFNSDLRLREEYYDNIGTLSSNAPNHEYNYQRYRLRFGVEATLFRNLDIGARVLTERRGYLKPDFLEGYRPDDFLFDKLYVTWRNAFSLPVKITVGRQELKMGNGWLIGDGTPDDGSKTNFFDVARVTVNWESAGTTLDLAEIVQPVHGNSWLPILHDVRKALTEQNENGFVANLCNKSMEKTEIDGYFIYKHNSKVLSNGDQGEIYAIGGTLEREFAAHWKMRVEMAPEWGTKNGRAVRAFGSNNRLTYSMNDKYGQKIRLGYEYLSGDNPSSKTTDEGFDILWGRWPQWSDLYSLAMVKENRISDWTNLHRMDFGWTIQPSKKLEITADYMPMFAPQNPYAAKTGFGSGKLRGSLGTVVFQYAFNKHISSKLQNEFFFPGKYYAADDRSFASFIRAEMMFVW